MINKRSKLVIFIICACVSCVYIIPQITNNNGVAIRQCILPIAFAISSDTHKKLREPLRQGVLYWNDALKHDIMFDFGDTGFTLESECASGFVMVGSVSKLSKTQKHYKNKSEPCGRTIMAFMPNGCIARAKVKINMECAGDPDLLQTVVRHEVGHILGLADSIDFTALMSGKIEPTMQHPVDANNKEIATVKKLYNLVEK